MTKILVVAEVKGDEISKSTLELLSQAKRLSFEAEAVLIGTGVAGVADTLAGHGASTVYLANDDSLALYNTSAYASAVKEAVEKSGANQLWLTASETGRDLTPRVAARLGVGAITDVAQLNNDGGQLTVMRPAMASKVVQQCSFKNDGLQVLSIRSGAFDVTPSEAVSANTIDLAIPSQDVRSIVKEVLVESSGEVDLNDAQIVVSVGRGVKGPEGVEAVRPLVKALGAAYGASRAVCDAGWMPHNTQVGQTGKVVTPDVYFAIGISGAIQHLAGMTGSKLIIAVNKDPEAPIFKVADYGIVGDLFKVVPILTEEIQKIKG